MTTAPVDGDVSPRRRSALPAYAALALLTAVEIWVAGLDGEARLRTTALCGLLLAKAGILLTFSLRATPRRATTRLALLAVVAAVGFAVVLMLEAAHRGRVG